ncbi:MAG: glycosyltransferase family 4 protein [Planctomycetota bacterium]
MRIAYCTSYISPYMAACWRAMSERDDTDLRVIAWDPVSAIAPFTHALMEGIDTHLVPKGDPNFDALTRPALAEFEPDVVVVGGWLNPAYRAFAQEKVAGARYFMAIDTPFKWNLRQRLGRFRFPNFYSSLEGVICTGERSYQLARVLGFPDHMIRRGMYGVDVRHWSAINDERRRGPWPKRFLYVGQLNERKGIDILADAYTRYRAGVTDPWPLTVCGTGPMAELLKNVEGVDFRGFTQPADLAAVKRESGVFVLAARMDSWPLVVVESSAAGLPVICSTDCGSLVEIVREYYNGITFDVTRTDHLTRAMTWMHNHHDRLPEMGERGVDMARPYDAKMWAERHAQWFNE